MANVHIHYRFIQPNMPRHRDRSASPRRQLETGTRSVRIYRRRMLSNDYWYDETADVDFDEALPGTIEVKTVDHDKKRVLLNYTIHDPDEEQKGRNQSGELRKVRDVWKFIYCMGEQELDPDRWVIFVESEDELEDTAVVIAF